MNVDGAELDIHVLPPDKIKQLFSAVDAARSLKQAFQKSEFRWGEPDLAPCPVDTPGLAVQRDVFEADGISCQSWRAPPQNSLHPGGE